MLGYLIEKNRDPKQKEAERQQRELVKQAREEGMITETSVIHHKVEAGRTRTVMASAAAAAARRRKSS